MANTTNNLRDKRTTRQGELRIAPPNLRRSQLKWVRPTQLAATVDSDAKQTIIAIAASDVAMEFSAKQEIGLRKQTIAIWQRDLHKERMQPSPYFRIVKSERKLLG